MADQSIVAVYHSMSEAEAAIRRLGERQFPINQVSILAQNLESEKEVQGFITTGDIAKEGAGTGAWVGGVFGLLMGGAFLFVPGFGPLVIAGSLAAVLLGTVEGAAFGAAGGGLLGALAGWGVSKQHIVKYEEHLKGGKYLVVANGTAEEVAQAQTILQGSSASDVNHHAEAVTSSTPAAMHVH